MTVFAWLGPGVQLMVTVYFLMGRIYLIMNTEDQKRPWGWKEAFCSYQDSWMYP